MIQDLQLVDKTNVQSTKLSGGMKKKTKVSHSGSNHCDQDLQPVDKTNLQSTKLSGGMKRKLR